MNPAPIVRTEALRHDYGGRPALRGVDLEVAEGAIFGLLGPNGGGKTTLFRILATLLPPGGGRASVLGHDVRRAAQAIRETIGVVFQAPALDRHLTVRENLLTQGRLYGLAPGPLRAAADALLLRFGLRDRAGDRAGVLSGGLRRRVEIAKALLHRPRLLILDEPSTGLDPGARRDLWVLLRGLRESDGVTILLTTHLVDEADACDRLAILSDGMLVACGAPAALKSEVGGDVIVSAARDPDALRADVERRFGGPVAVVDGTVRIERAAGHELIPRLVEAFADRIDAVTLGRPTLLDVFVHKTGRRFAGGAGAA
jgi:ABC-2 type transport system ATP-binding protein